jgi:hypothetical protein
MQGVRYAYNACTHTETEGLPRICLWHSKRLMLGIPMDETELTGNASNLPSSILPGLNFSAWDLINTRKRIKVEATNIRTPYSRIALHTKSIVDQLFVGINLVFATAESCGFDSMDSTHWCRGMETEGLSHDG